jgi:hypothetical protein
MIIVGGILFLPISPKITGTFTIQTTTIYGQQNVAISLVTASYSKQTIAYSSFLGNGNVSLPLRPIQSGSYNLTIEVRYGSSSPQTWSEPIASHTFDSIGDGTYGFQVSFLFRQEQPGLVYLITLQVSGTNLLKPVSFSFLTSP